MIAPKLKPGDTVRVIAPSGSYLTSWITPDVKAYAKTLLTERLGLQVTYGRHLEQIDAFGSSPVQDRLDDLHDAFRDPAVKLVLCARGGFNSNQLLDRIDYDLIRTNPKILCGFSDITALANAIHAKTGLVTYSGPNYSTLGHAEGIEYTLEAFKRCLFSDAPFDLEPSEEWFDLMKTDGRAEQKHAENEGMIILQPGTAEGRLLGGNACTFNMLQGTPYFPDMTGSILFLEDDYESQPHHFVSHLQSIILQPSFKGVKGLVLGRFEGQSRMTEELIRKSVAERPELKDIPVVAGADFGHTLPALTLPIGGRVRMDIAGRAARISILEH